jgi:hypothetical protein
MTTTAVFIDKQVAVDYILAHDGVDLSQHVKENVTSAKKIYSPEENNTAILVYEFGFIVETQPTPMRPYFIINACSLDVIIYANRVRCHS